MSKTKKYSKTVCKNAIDDIRSHAGSNMAKSPLLEFRELTTCNEKLESIPTDASLYLTLELSGYGSMKTKWKTILMFTGAIETVVQGIAVGDATQNAWLGLGVAAEEMTSEYLTWNGVDWLLGETYAPVTLEGQMIYMQTVKTIGKASYYVTENSDELSNLSKEERKDKSKQLKASLHKAERKLISNLNSYITKEVLQELD